MSVIYKYPVVPMNKVQFVEMPSSSTILSAIEQSGSVVIYALVPDPDPKTIWNDRKRILVLGTGWEFDERNNFRVKSNEEMRFVNTVKAGLSVWHVFEIIFRGDTI